MCFNGVIAPIVGYGIKGVIWYQGESNADSFKDAVEYKDLFPRMITNWRDEWGQGDFPFLYVQLPNFRAAAITPSSGNWPWLREAQEKTLSLPNTGMAVITDAGEAMDIHPSDKSDPGNRLGLVALHDIYGKKVVASGPVYKSMKVDGNKIIISFDDIHKGLIIGRPNADGIVNNSPAELKGFGIAGADHKFVWAKAVMKGNKIIVYADGITIPEAVRYNWADNPPGNLYNKDGLPARPFRTDSWAPAL
ncbi:sialate O-acetylesterase [Mucilaginibacter antarcticus]|uniref:sialate O-acetylesterase n=1 Tax=Mucilaginibacter antarcticus TaxID=1855725 RepID=UPI00363CFF67